MTSNASWTWVCRLSQRVIDKVNKDNSVTIPQDKSCNPLLEFEETLKKKSVFRFAVYILWLKNQAEVLYWFDEVRKKYLDLVDEMVSKMSSWFPDIKCEEECTGTAV